ncbi:class II histocompatibility antigen, M alpha chain, partial [Sigmodon hispidus]
MFCQDGNPNIGLSESYDEDQLFSYDLSQNTRVPRLPDCADWAQEQGDASDISFDKNLCEAMIEQMGPELEGQVPVSRDLPMAEVFTLKPLEFGKPNTLVCFISNLFPPTLTVTWQHHPTFISAVSGLTFQAFSYLNFTPEPFDLYSCIMTREIDSYIAIAYQVPQDALPSELENEVML